MGHDLKLSEPSAWHSWFAQNRIITLLVLLAISVGADQATKIWAQERLARPRPNSIHYIHDDTVVVIPNAFSLIYRENPAAAFSLTRGIPENIRKPMLVGVSAIAMIVFLVWYLRAATRDGLHYLSLALVLGGALGNFIDRVRLSYVIDFINWEAGFINPAWPPWPTFNIADSCIVVGAALLIFRSFKPFPEDL